MSNNVVNLDDVVFDIYEAAEYIGCCESKLRRMVRNREGPSCYKIGTKYLFRKSKVVEWIENLEKKQEGCENSEVNRSGSKS